MPQTIKKTSDIWKKYGTWISSAGFVVIIAFACYFVVIPIRKNMEKNSEEAQSRIADREIYEKRISEISEMEKTLTVFQANESNLRVFLNKNNEVDFIRNVEAMAEETNNKITLKIEDKKDPITKKEAVKKDEELIKESLPRDKYLALQITLEGDYEAMLNFLNKLENMSFYVNVLSLDLNKSVVEKETNPFKSTNNPKGEVNTQKEVLTSTLNVVAYLEN